MPSSEYANSVRAWDGSDRRGETRSEGLLLLLPAMRRDIGAYPLLSKPTSREDVLAEVLPCAELICLNTYLLVKVQGV